MSNSNSKSKSKLNQPQKVDVKGGDVKAALSIIIPIVLIFGFLVGGALLFIRMEDARYVPDDRYLKSEEIVNSGELIGLTREQCSFLLVMMPFDDCEGNWTFSAGMRIKDSLNFISYEVYIVQEDGRAVSAVIREEIFTEGQCGHDHH
jgi:hypothetical protein